MRTPTLALLAGSLLLAGCGGGGTTTTNATPATTAAKPTTRAAIPAATMITIRIKDGKPVGGITRTTVEKGRLVALVVHSDVADEVHLHGYRRKLATSGS